MEMESLSSQKIFR